MKQCLKPFFFLSCNLLILINNVFYLVKKRFNELHTHTHTQKKKKKKKLDVNKLKMERNTSLHQQKDMHAEHFSYGVGTRAYQRRCINLFHRLGDNRKQ